MSLDAKALGPIALNTEVLEPYVHVWFLKLHSKDSFRKHVGAPDITSRGRDLASDHSVSRTISRVLSEIRHGLQTLLASLTISSVGPLEMKLPLSYRGCYA